jgi:hypothetical protein
MMMVMMMMMMMMVVVVSILSQPYGCSSIYNNKHIMLMNKGGTHAVMFSIRNQQNSTRNKRAVKAELLTA